MPADAFLSELVERTSNFLDEPITSRSVLNIEQQLAQRRAIGSENLKSMLPAFMVLNDLNDLPTLPNHYQMDQSYGDDFEQIYEDHNTLIGKILWQEDIFI